MSPISSASPPAAPSGPRRLAASGLLCGAMLFGAILALAGCAAGPDVAEVMGAQYHIDTIGFEGNERFDDDELLDHMMMGETSWLPFTETFWFNPAFVPADRRRIEQLYRAYGYYEIEVTDARVTRDEDEVDIVFVLVEGEPTMLSEVTFDWQGDPDVGDVPPEERPERTDEDKREVEALAITVTGEPFEIAALNQSVNDMELALRERGHALAEISEKAVVDREARTAKITYRIDPGPVVHVGELDFEGLGYAPRDLVAREVDYAPGRRYTPSLMDRIEASVYGMDVFRSVVAMPQEEASEGKREVDIRVRADASPPKTLKLGFGLAFDPTRWEQRVTARYTDRNLFGRLTRLDLDVIAGYAELPEPFTLAQHGPVAEFSPSLRKKGLLEKRLVWTLSPSVEVGIEEGYQFWSIENRISVSRFFFGLLELTLSHNLRHVDFFGFGTGCLPPDPDMLGPDGEPIVDEECVRSAAVGFFDLGDDVDPESLPDDLGFRDPYQISYLQLEGRLFFTDRVVDPQDGVILSAVYDYVGGIVGGDFDFHRVTPSARAYWTPHPRLQFAARVETGQIHPFGDDPAVPIDMRYYLGGATTVRGWGLQRLAPRSDPACNDHVENGCGGIPIGGLTTVLGNVEVRWEAFSPVILATFLDAGDVRAGVAEYDLGELYYSTGGGIRVDSPVGKIRLDIGVRINDPARFGTEDRWAFHLGLGEAF